MSSRLGSSPNDGAKGRWGPRLGDLLFSRKVGLCNCNYSIAHRAPRSFFPEVRFRFGAGSSSSENHLNILCATWGYRGICQ